MNCEGDAHAIFSACSCVMQPRNSPTLTAAVVPVETELGEKSDKGMEQRKSEGGDEWEYNQEGARGRPNHEKGSWSWWMKGEVEGPGGKQP